MSRLGDTIRAAREKAGLTPKALGKKCGVAESFIADVEAGRKIVSDEQAQRLLKALGTTNPVSAELEVAAESPQPVRPRPKPYVLPVQQPEAPPPSPAERAQTQASADAWLDALAGVVKRVPVIDGEGVVIDHRLLPIIGGRIEGGHPDKVLYFRMENDSLRGFRIYAGDLLLVIPAAAPVDEAIMLLQIENLRVVRKLKKMDGGRLMLQTYDREFEGTTIELRQALILGHCVRLEKQLLSEPHTGRPVWDSE